MPDEDAGEPCGDAPAAATVIGRRWETRFAQEVHRPALSGWIVAACHHFGDHDLFERYLRIFHGITNIASASYRDVTVVIFDTGDHREHAGITRWDDDTTLYGTPEARGRLRLGFLRPQLRHR